MTCPHCQRPLYTISSRCQIAVQHERTTLRYHKNVALEAKWARQEKEQTR